MVSQTTDAIQLIHVPNGYFLQVSSLGSVESSRDGRKSLGGGVSVTSDSANQQIRAFFSEYLRKRLINDHLVLLGSPWTRHSIPCEDTVSVSLTERLEVTSHAGPSVEEHIRTLSVLFLALNPVKGSTTGNSARSDRDANTIQISWITRLFNVIFPGTGSIRGTDTTLALLDPPSVIRAWISEVLQWLDPTTHEHNFATLLVICLALASELYPDHVPVKAIPRARLKRDACSHPGGLRRPDLLTEDLCRLFQRDSPLNLSRLIDTIE